MASATADEIASGSFFLKVNVSETTGLQAGASVQFPPFRVGDHTWVAHYYPNGVQPKDSGYASLGLALTSEARSVNAFFEFTLLDLNGRPASSTSAWRRGAVVFSSGQLSHTAFQFMKKRDLRQYLQGEFFVVICTLTVVDIDVQTMSSRAVSPTHSTMENPPQEPSHDLYDDLNRLYESHELSDTSISVHGTEFPAHSFVLAARSQEFRNKLFGGKHEAHEKKIQIDDVEPLVFKALVHFIYTDSLLDDAELSGGAEKDGEIKPLVTALQKLYKAADKYEVERLKMICEDKLCSNISVDTIASTLLLVCNYNCPKLRATCLRFLAVRDNFHDMTLTEEYDQLVTTENGRAILREIRERHRAAR